MISEYTVFADGEFISHVEGGRSFIVDDYSSLKTILALYESRCLVKERGTLLAVDCDISNYGLCEYRGIN